MRDSLTKDVFKHNFKKVLKPQYIDQVFNALGMCEHQNYKVGGY